MTQRPGLAPHHSKGQKLPPLETPRRDERPPTDDDRLWRTRACGKCSARRGNFLRSRSNNQHAAPAAVSNFTAAVERRAKAPATARATPRRAALGQFATLISLHRRGMILAMMLRPTDLFRSWPCLPALTIAAKARKGSDTAHSSSRRARTAICAKWSPVRSARIRFWPSNVAECGDARRGKSARVFSAPMHAK